MINQKLYAWIEKNGKISTWQRGFRRRMGRDLQCVCLRSVIVHQFANQNGHNNKCHGQVFACFIDFKKAYDSVNHKLLWEKLTDTGISRKILNLLKSMHKNISYRVKLLNFVSNSLFVLLGWNKDACSLPSCLTL